MKRVLALDLGSKTGYALDVGDYPVSCGTVLLATPAQLKQQKEQRLDRRCDIRYGKLLNMLRAFAKSYRIDWIVFEDVEFAKTRLQAHLWATWRAAVWTVALDFGIEVDCCATGTLKKFATGSGAADKKRMADYLIQNPRFVRHPKHHIVDTKTGLGLDDNAVDALHLLAWAKHTLGRL